MKKIINGKRYDTETAIELASYANDFSDSDFRAMEETLYKTKKGNYFLSGSGGPMSKYAKSCVDMIGSGSDIILVTKQEAFTWLEEKTNNTEIIEKHFSDSIEEG